MMKKCPICKKPIKLENMKRHLKRVHPKEKVDIKYTKKEKKILEEHDEKVRELEKPIGLGKIVAVAVFIIIALIAVTVFYPQSPSGYGIVPLGSKIDELDFTVTDIDGNRIKLSDWKDQVIVLDFIQSTCGACLSNTQGTMTRINQDYGSHIKMLSVSIRDQDTIQDLMNFKNASGLVWPIALDTAGAQSMYGVTHTPTIFIFNSQGEIAYSHVGTESYETLAPVISNLL